MSSSIGRIIATLHLSKHIPDLCNQANAVILAMTDNPTFPAPTVPLVTASAHVAELVGAEAVKTRTKGTIPARNEKRAQVISDMHQLKAYVQAIADANPATAEKVIAGAGMSVRQVTPRAKGDFEVRNGPFSGDVLLIARSAGARASYVWQVSTDQIDWTTLPVTVTARTAAHGLTRATTYYFRFRTVTKAGEGGWSQVIALLVT